ncbi:MAG TPA: hypothetical protein VNU72_05505 [Puia sp.]|jgi:hypothetical protein|nr:hypothetical protein [Puia sp.]
MIIDSSFSGDYKLTVQDEIKNGLEVVYFPGGSSTGGTDGVIVRVSEIEKKGWQGIFAFGDITKKGVSGIFGMPDSNKFCVVSRGNGFIVSANCPREWDSVECMPVMDVKTSVEHKIIIFASYTHLVAYGEKGIRWTTVRLSFDGLTITGLAEDIIQGRYYDIRSGRLEDFKVSLKDGSVLDSNGSIVF